MDIKTDKVKKAEVFFRNKIQHFDQKKYFKMYDRVTHYSADKGIIEKFICIFYLYKIKLSDARNMATLGAHLGYGAVFPGGVLNFLMESEASRFQMVSG